MLSTVKYDVRIFPDLEALSRAAARSLADRIRAVVTSGGRFDLALSGGNTPRLLYRLLGTEYRDEIAWPHVHLFWSDERYVPQSDSRSNYRLVRENLLDYVPIPTENIHPMPTNLAEADDAACAYEKVLKDHFSSPWPRLSLALLGLGADGHTASLFPGSPVLEEKERSVVAVHGPSEPRLRLTLTWPALRQAAEIYFLLAGADKARALARTLAAERDPKSYPAASLASGHGAVVWWVDAAAAALLPKPLRPQSTEVGR